MNHLTSYQKLILDECIAKKNGGLSLPMGSGKTLISLCLSESLKSDNSNFSLIIVSKTLLSSWINEIKKFYNDSLNYYILHKDFNDIDNIKFDKTKSTLFITTPSIITKAFKESNILHKIEELIIVNEGQFNQHTIKCYNKQDKPCVYANINKKTINYKELLYGITWNCIIVDEVQNFSNIESLICKGIVCIYAKHRWGISGTIINEPKISNILGYFMIVNYPCAFNNIPHLELYLKSDHSFKGIQDSLVYRKTNEMYVPVKKNVNIIEHEMTKYEISAYMCLKNILKDIRQIYKNTNNIDIRRSINASLMSMILFLRQLLLCSPIPYSSISLQLNCFENNKDNLNQIIRTNINKYKLHEQFNNIDCVRSSRINEILKLIDNHKNDKVIVFSSFRTFIDIIKTFIPEYHVLESGYSIKKRNQVISDFEQQENGGVLLLTYAIGSEGLNLQCCNTVILCDLWWNDSVINQAIARIDRYGQMNKELFVYFLTSNTALEKEIIDKNKVKQNQINELFSGKMLTVNKHTINMERILNLLENGDNTINIQSLFKAL